MKKLLVLFCMVVMLAACGGGDGGGSSSGMTDAEIRGEFPGSASLLLAAGCTHMGTNYLSEYAVDSTIYECSNTLDASMKAIYEAYVQELGNVQFAPEEAIGETIDGDYFGLYEKIEGSKVYTWNLYCESGSAPCDVVWHIYHDITKYR